MNLILLGPPGAGKGTQSSFISKRFSIIQLSTGDMLRSLIKEDSPLASKVKNIMKEGSLVSDDIIVTMIRERVLMEDCKNGFILDGFPRTRIQAEALDLMLSDLNKSLNSVIQISVNDEHLIDRILSRFTCSNCGEGYNSKFKLPKHENICDICKCSEFNYREDDNKESLKKRLKSYYDNTLPLIPYYKEKNILSVVDGMQEIDVVSKEIINILEH